MGIMLTVIGAIVLAGGAWQRWKSPSIQHVYFSNVALAAGFLLMLAGIMGWGCGENAC